MAQLKEGSVIKKSTGDEIIATVNDIPEIPTSLPANGGNADTIGGFTVGADVPANAKFTDTIVDISGKQDKLTAGNNITITSNTISATDTGSIVDLGTFNDNIELFTHVVMNQSPTGCYTFIIDEHPYFMLLKVTSTHYYLTIYDNRAMIYYYEVTRYGVVEEAKFIDLRTLMTDISL